MPAMVGVLSSRNMDSGFGLRLWFVLDGKLSKFAATLGLLPNSPSST